MVRQDHLVRSWVDLECRLEQPNASLCVEQWGESLRTERETSLTALNGLSFAEREVFLLRMDAEHAMKAVKAAG